MGGLARPCRRRLDSRYSNRRWFLILTMNDFACSRLREIWRMLVFKPLRSQYLMSGLRRLLNIPVNTHYLLTKSKIEHQARMACWVSCQTTKHARVIAHRRRVGHRKWDYLQITPLFDPSKSLPNNFVTHSQWPVWSCCFPAESRDLISGQV